MRSLYERSTREKEEVHRARVKEYQERDNAWQDEKQVKKRII